LLNHRIRASAALFTVLSIIIMASNPTVMLHAQSNNNSNQEPIKIILTLWPPNFLAYIAQEKGIFEKNGVNVQLMFVKDYFDAVERYDNDDADGITLVFSDAMIQDSNGIPTKVVYNIDSSQSGDAIVSKLKNLTELKGKKIGVEGINSFSHLFALKALEKAGLGEGDVQFVNVAGPNISLALDTGEIDAGHTYSPFLEEATAKGYHILITAIENPGIIVSILAFHAGIVDQRPLDIKNIIKSLIESLDYYNENKDQSLQVMSSASGLTKDELTYGFHNTKLMTLRDNLISMANITGNMSSMYTLGEYSSNFFTQKGVMSDYANIDAIIDPQFVKAIAAEKKVPILGNGLK
jgi:NitT/TauT family transport system substrate-binding protein